ncbi:MAG: NUDIX domain-containing protein [Asticcacaulis sp.]|nr:NUDIX domain-containing protein [Asticcacaulis sp.]
MEAQFDTAVMIGRFAPWRRADRAALDRLLTLAPEVVIVIGTAGAPRSTQTPWTAGEREAMIRADIGDDARVRCLAVPDRLYRETEWWQAIQQNVTGERVCVTGARILAAPWPTVDVAAVEPLGPKVRKAWFCGDDALVDQAVSPSVRGLMGRPSSELQAEYDYVADYRRSWAAAPYPPIFVTVDMALVHTDEAGVRRLLLIRRGGLPGRGLWALPGGFVDQDETLIDAAFRELREETGATGGGTIRKRVVFDAPFRSARGRTISHGYLMEVVGDVPIVAAADDAADARWTPLDEVWTMREQMFEDHLSIIDRLLGQP